MIIKDNSKDTDFPPTPAGLWPAVCYGIVDIGTHEESWQNELKERHSMYILFELPTLTIEVEEETKPRGISKKFTKSLHKKSALRAFLESWRGCAWSDKELKEKGFDMRTLLGVNCQLNIVHNVTDDKTYANIATVVPLSKGMTKYEPFNELVCYDIRDGVNIPESVPEWLREKIFDSFEINVLGQQNDEWNEPPQEPNSGPFDEDSIPF